MNVDRDATIRIAALYLPIAIGAVACALRRPTRSLLIGAFMALVWSVPAIAAVHVAALAASWWRFDVSGGVLLGIPVDVWLGWALLWGPVTYIAFPRFPLAAVVAIALLFDVILMPLAAPVVQLSDAWLVGECTGLALVLIPAQLLARWTISDRRLAARATLQAIAFSVLMAGIVPAMIVSASDLTWLNPLEWSSGRRSVALQILGLPTILGLSAVQEFVTRGDGTPIPFDPPRHIVTSGPYAYVRNPMQVSTVVLLLLIGAVIGNVFVALGGVMCVVYSMGIANWDESGDLYERFGDAWRDYQQHVRPWWPRWRPWYDVEKPVAVLYVAEECGMCSEVAHWYRCRRVRGMRIMAAEDHPRQTLSRITYESTDGTCSVSGIHAIARALEHVHLGWAFAGFAMRLPIVSQAVQLIVDAAGGQPRAVRRRIEKPI